MIRGAVLPGETVEAAVEDERKDYLSASVERILRPSAERISPACEFFGKCGGCHFQHIPYDRQIEIKERILLDCLKRLAGTETELSAPVVSDKRWNYRLRGQFKVSGEGTGFYREGTRETVDIDGCRLMTPEINTFFRKAKTLVKGPGVKEIHITCGDCVIALIRTRARSVSPADRDMLASRFLDSGFSGLLIGTAGGEVFRYGRGFVALNLGTLRYTVSPMSFFQSNWSLNQAVVRIIRETLQPLGGGRILDLYAGAGNFSLPLAMDAEVTAVEENPYAVQDGVRNLEINNIKDCRFVRSSAEDFQPEGRFDIAILDPPRPGLTNRAMSKVLAAMPERIVYISCNPATLARDVKKLSVRYVIESVRIADLFPQTFHIEAVVFLRLK